MAETAEAEVPPLAFAAAPPYVVPAGDVDELFEAFENEVAANFPGQRYWVARHGLVVTHQIEGDAVEGEECATLDEARAAFAERCCDDRPGGPQAGDTIVVHWGEAEGQTLTVERVDAARDAEWQVTATGRGTPLWLRYGSTGSPAGPGPPAASTSPPTGCCRTAPAPPRRPTTSRPAVRPAAPWATGVPAPPSPSFATSADTGHDRR